MDWTSKEPATSFCADGRINRRAELKRRLETVVVSGKESKLVRLFTKSTTAANGCALFEDVSNSKTWAAAVLTKVDGKEMSYILIPEWENPDFCQCDRPFLEELEKSGAADHPAAEAWRRKCREALGCGESLSTPSDSSAFENLPEGTHAIWTVGDGGPAYLPKGKQVMLEKVMVRQRYCWRDVDSGALYADSMVPESDRQVLKGSFRR